MRKIILPLCLLFAVMGFASLAGEFDQAQRTTFNNTANAINITFYASSSNNSIGLKLPKFVTVLNATINLTGHYQSYGLAATWPELNHQYIAMAVNGTDVYIKPWVTDNKIYHYGTNGTFIEILTLTGVTDDGVEDFATINGSEFWLALDQPGDVRKVLATDQSFAVVKTITPPNPTCMGATAYLRDIALNRSGGDGEFWLLWSRNGENASVQRLDGAGAEIDCYNLTAEKIYAFTTINGSDFWTVNTTGAFQRWNTSFVFQETLDFVFDTTTQTFEALDYNVLDNKFYSLDRLSAVSTSVYKHGEIYPEGVLMDINMDGVFEFNHSTVFNETGMVNLTASINSYLAGCYADASRNCTLPINISSTAGGLLELSDLVLNFTYIDLTNCSLYNNFGISLTPTLNFTLLNETNDAKLEGDMEMAFDIPATTSNERTATNYSYSFFNGNNASICLSPNWGNHTTDLTLEYSKTGYSTRYYYLDDAFINNITNSILLYLAPSGETTTITIYVKDSGNNEVVDAIVMVQLYDIGTNTYTTVEVLKTDLEGKATVSLVTPNWYKFIVSKDGEVLQSFGPINILTTTTSVTLKLSIGTFGEFFDVYTQIDRDCTFNNATNVFRCEATDTSGLFNKFEWEVQHNLASGYSTICNDTATTSSVTFTCLLPNVSSVGQGNTYRYYLIVHHQSTRTLLKSGWLEFHGSLSAFTAAYGISGTILFFITLIILPLAFSPIPPLAVAMVPATFFIGGMLRWIEIGMESIIAIAVVAAIIIYVLESGKRTVP